MIQLTLTLKMTTAQVVEASATVNNNSPIQDFVHPDDQTQPFENYNCSAQTCKGDSLEASEISWTQTVVEKGSKRCSERY